MRAAIDLRGFIRALDARRCAAHVAARFAVLGLALGLAIYGPWYVMPFAFVLIGVAQYHILVLSHEAQHRLIARDRRLNDLIGAWCLAYPFGQPFHSERARHLAHHHLVGEPTDPDFQRYVLDDKRPWRPMLLYFARLAAYGKVWEYLSSAWLRRARPAVPSPDDTRSGGELVVVATVQLVLLATFTLLASPWSYFVFWLAPLCLVTTTLSEFRELCEHASAPETPLHLKTFRAPVWQRLVIGPVGFAYHAEHHLYPSIPHYWLPEVARRHPQTDEFEVHASYFDVLRRCRSGTVAAPTASCA